MEHEEKIKKQSMLGQSPQRSVCLDRIIVKSVYFGFFVYLHNFLRNSDQLV